MSFNRLNGPVLSRTAVLLLSALGTQAMAAADAPAVSAYAEQTAVGKLTASVKRYTLQADAKLYVPVRSTSPTVLRAFPKGLFPDVGSGLAFKGKNKGVLEFYGVADRGPNTDGPGKVSNPAGSGSKSFPVPDFHPTYGLIRVTDKAATLVTSVPLIDATGRKMTGLPPAPAKVGAAEIPLTADFRFDPALSAFDPDGLDLEAIVFDKARGVLWMSDEYGPFVLKVDPASGRILHKYAPGPGATDLPAVLGERRSNRGMEGLALDGATGKLYGAMQSPIDPLDATGKSLQATPLGGKATDIRNQARVIRWMEFDPSTERSRLFVYPVDGVGYDKGRTGTTKLGDVTVLGKGRFLVIEQGARASDGKIQNWLMLVEMPATATDVATLGHDLEISSITGAPSQGVDFAAVVPLKKTRLLDLNAAGWNTEKAEGVALVDAHTIALINDNDFSIHTVLSDASGNPVNGNVEDCALDATNGTLSACGAAVTAGVAPLSGPEHQVQFWLIRFDQDLTALPSF